MGDQWFWAGTVEKIPPQINPILILVDIENLCGEPRPAASRISAAKKFLDALIGGDPLADKYVVGCHHSLRSDVEKVWRESGSMNREIRFRSGKDGADLALSEWLTSNLSMLETFNSLVIGSGDHFFTDKALVKNAYEKFDPNHILQVAASPQNKSHKFENFSHHVAYFTDVNPKHISLLREDEIQASSRRYSLLGKKLLGVRSFRDERKPLGKVNETEVDFDWGWGFDYLEDDTRDVESDDFEVEEVTRCLIRDGKTFSYVNWFRDHDWEFTDTVYLSNSTMEQVETAGIGDEVEITDSLGQKYIYRVFRDTEG